MLSRRTLMVAGSLTGALLPHLARAARTIPQRASARVIIDNDFAGDPDGLVALAHQLLTPKTRVTLVTSLPLSSRFAPPSWVGHSAAMGRQVALDLISRAGVPPVPVMAGAETFGGDVPSDAARAIVAEAMRDDPLPLIFTCGGPLTNLAEALRLEPRIARRMKLIWIGGGAYPDGAWEYNFSTDPKAARAVIACPGLEIWQVPQNAYRQMEISIAELNARLPTVSPLGRWIYGHFLTLPAFVQLNGAYPLGDSPLVLLSAITTESSEYQMMPARVIGDDGHYGAEIPGRTIRVYERLDAQLTFEDFFALMAAQRKA